MEPLKSKTQGGKKETNTFVSQIGLTYFSEEIKGILKQIQK
jgi:hypothetical protein